MKKRKSQPGLAEVIRRALCSKHVSGQGFPKRRSLKSSPVIHAQSSGMNLGNSPLHRVCC